MSLGGHEHLKKKISAHFFTSLGGHEHLKKIISVRFSLIYHFSLWGIGILAPPSGSCSQAPLLAETVPCSIFLRLGEGGQVINPPWAHNVPEPALLLATVLMQKER